MRVEVLNQAIDRQEGKLGVRICKIATHWDQDVVSLVVLMLVNDHIHEVAYLCLSVKCLESGISDNWIISVELIIKPESLRVAVVIIH